MKYFNIFACVFAVFVLNCATAYGRVIFNDAETDVSDLDTAQIAEQTKLPVIQSEQISPEESPKSNAASPIFPDESESDSVSEPEGPKNETPVVPAESPDGRTFHHLAALHHKVETKVNYLLAKLIHPFLPHAFFQDEPQHQPHYYQPNSFYDVYRKDNIAIENPVQTLFKPLNYLVNHPINFKERLANLHHKLGKRSIEEPTTTSSRQAKTLYKLIPNFEANVNSVMKRILGPIYGSKPSNGFFLNQAETPYKSDSPAQAVPVIKFTTVMRMLPQILQRMTQIIGFPHRVSGTPTVHQS